MTLAQRFQDPLQAKLSVARVFWLYGVAGSLAYGVLEFFIDPANMFLTRLYVIGGCLYSAYVIIGTYRCAVNCASPLTARIVRISSVISLILLPIITYFELSGSFGLDLAPLG